MPAALWIGCSKAKWRVISQSLICTESDIATSVDSKELNRNCIDWQKKRRLGCAHELGPTFFAEGNALTSVRNLQGMKVVQPGHSRSLFSVWKIKGSQPKALTFAMSAAGKVKVFTRKTRVQSASIARSQGLLEHFYLQLSRGRSRNCRFSS